MQKITNEWMNVEQLVLYGWGNVGRKCFPKLKKDFTILAIIDNDITKQGHFQGVPIVGADDSLELLKTKKIIVLTGGKVYKNISDSLRKIGLCEYVDFCSIETFISEWYWSKRAENCLMEVHTAVTMSCTFNCKNCNMFVPYYCEKVNYSANELKLMYDLFFKYVDYVFCITLLGGEPFIASVTGELIDYLGKKYDDRIGVINIISNGSIVPNDEMIEIMRRNNVLVYISDYSDAIPYKKKLVQVVKKLQDSNIECVVFSSKEWKDFRFPVSAYSTDLSIREHMMNCAPLFHGLNDNKFYFCHVAWSAEKAGLYRLKKSDYVDLDELDVAEKRKLVQHAMGEMEEKHVSLCSVCGGCGEDNPNNVKAAIQMRGKV